MLTVETGMGEGFIENAINTLKDIFVVFDLYGNLSIWNRSALEITGYTEQEAETLSIADFFSKDDFGRVAETITRGVEEGYASVEMDLVCKGGKVIPYEFYGSPLMDCKGNPVAVSAIGRNITERKELIEREKEVAVAQAEREAASKHSRELQDLITLAAHELRHPATVFKGYARMLLDYGDQLDEQTMNDALAAIEASADRLARIITELFETSLIEQKELELDYREVLPSSLIAGSFGRVHTFGVECRYSVKPFGEEQREILVDPERTQEVLAAVIENAVKYTANCETIEIWFEQDSDETAFFVADRGPGVPEYDRERIFERFCQVEDVEHHSRPGIGLGLHIAKCVVEAHEGWIKVESREGGGSVFSFMLPNRIKAAGGGTEW